MASAVPYWEGRPILSVDGAVNEALTLSMRSLIVMENLEGLFRCELTLSNWGRFSGHEGYLDASEPIDFGASLSVAAPAAGGSGATLFTGRVTALEALFPAREDPQMTVLAEDQLQDLRMTRRTRSFTGPATLTAVIGAIASAHQLQAEVSVTAPETYTVLAQVNQTDLAFLRELGRNVDAEVWADGSTLHVKSHVDRPAESIQMTYPKELWEFSVLADLAGQRTSLAVTGWDVTAKEPVTATATAGDLGSELEGTSGASVLSAKLSAHTEQIAHLLAPTNAEAGFVAKAAYRRMARRFLTGSGVCQGDPRVRVGAYVNLIGLGPRFSGRYYIVAVRHLFDEVRGYRTEFRVERPGIGG
jgi:phage protein D